MMFEDDPKKEQIRLKCILKLSWNTSLYSYV
jgi:hypothetical protein